MLRRQLLQYSVVCRLQDANRAVLEERERSQRNDQQLSDYEAEIGLLRRRLETLETDRDKDKKTIAQLQDALNRARVVCMSHIFKHILSLTNSYASVVVNYNVTPRISRCQQGYVT